MKKCFFDNLKFFLFKFFKIFIIHYENIIEFCKRFFVKWKKIISFGIFDIKINIFYSYIKFSEIITRKKISQRNIKNIPCFSENFYIIGSLRKICLYSNIIKILFLFPDTINRFFVSSIKSRAIIFNEKIMWNSQNIYIIYFFDE